ncbi:MAG TPA: DUF1993 domain-containing protein [Polyangiaceae bacterium]|jgi:uncharacterized protein|nr:DUF1993 domain-containing protein [Polyangiaceae bacterium]
MNVHVIVLEMKKLLRSLDGCIDKAVAHAQARKFDPNVLLDARLAPDMFAFVRQVQACCDQAKFAAARTAGKDAPSHPDNETTMVELKQRVAAVVSYLDGFSERDFDGVDERTVALPRWEGKSLTATNYLVEHAMPNFFFHLTMAYALLRHNGVDVGKRDFLGQLSWS